MDEKTVALLEDFIREDVSLKIPTAGIPAFGIPTFINYWKNVPKNLIKTKMSKILSKITDIPILIIYWECVSSDSETGNLIKARMSKILSKITDIPILIIYWECVLSDSRPGKLIEARILKILKVELPKITDMSTLIDYWKNVPRDSKPGKLIKIRIIALVKEINKNNIPQWYIKLVEKKANIPYSIIAIFKDKARELLS